MQLGIFQSLMIETYGKAELKSVGDCLRATEMEFSILSRDQSLERAIDKYWGSAVFQEFHDSYIACKYTGHVRNV